MQLTVLTCFLLLVATSSWASEEIKVEDGVLVPTKGNFKVATTDNKFILGEFDVLEVYNTPWIVSEVTRPKVYIKSKATQMYLCFNQNWRIVGMKASSEKKLPKRCFFYEGPGELNTHIYYSIINQRKRLGFNRRGKPIGPRMRANENCFRFNKLPALVDDNQRIDNLHNNVNNRNHKLVVDGLSNSHQVEHSIQHHSARHHHDDLPNVLKRRKHQQQHRHSNHKTNHQLQEVEPSTAIGNGQGSRRPGGIGPQRKGRKNAFEKNRAYRNRTKIRILTSRVESKKTSRVDNGIGL